MTCEIVHCRNVFGKFVLPDFGMEICAHIIILCFCEGLIYELNDSLTLAHNIIVMWLILWLLASISLVWFNYKLLCIYSEYVSKSIKFCSIQEVKRFYWNKPGKMVQKLSKMLVIPQTRGNWWRSIKLENLLRYIWMKFSLIQN